MLGHLVSAGDAQVDFALADKGRDISCRQEYQRDGQVLDERDVEARVAVELYV